MSHLIDLVTTDYKGFPTAASFNDVVLVDFQRDILGGYAVVGNIGIPLGGADMSGGNGFVLMRNWERFSNLRDISSGIGRWGRWMGDGSAGRGFNVDRWGGGSMLTGGEGGGSTEWVEAGMTRLESDTLISEKSYEAAEPKLWGKKMLERGRQKGRILHDEIQK
jgi:hypothetical protein